jgi:transcriptional regulator with XRE-family HTH domain
MALGGCLVHRLVLSCTEKIRMVPNSVTRICNNESQPSLMVLRKIALELDVDIRELLIPTK